jgi:NADH-quinone oxidoreductase subunit J
MSFAIFLPLAILAILSALGVVVSRNPVRSAMCLVATLFLLAVMFVFLDAYIVAVLQVLVYAGAIMVLFLFVIMLLNLQEEPPEPVRMGMRTVVMALGAAFVLLMSGAVGSVGLRTSAVPGGEFGSTAALSERLFTQFLLPFEITSLLLLIAIVGAVVIAKRKMD